MLFKKKLTETKVFVMDLPLDKYRTIYLKRVYTVQYIFNLSFASYLE